MVRDTLLVAVAMLASGGVLPSIEAAPKARTKVARPIGTFFDTAADYECTKSRTGCSFLRAISTGTSKISVIRPNNQGAPRFGAASHNGANLAFYWSEDDLPRWEELRVLSTVDKHERTLLRNKSNGRVLWSPDGAIIAMERRHIALIDPERNEYWKWAPCSQRNRPGLPGSTADENSPNLALQFRDEGIVFLTHGVDHPKGVITCHWNGTLERHGWLPDNVGLQWSLSPDLRRVAFVDTERERLVVAPVDGKGAPRVVGKIEKSLHDPVWSPDGQWLAIAVDDRRPSKLVAFNIATGKSVVWGSSSYWIRAQWIDPKAKPSNVDMRARLTQALGPGTPFTPPLDCVREEDSNHEQNLPGYKPVGKCPFPLPVKAKASPSPN